jgi:hypothetical protein
MGAIQSRIKSAELKSDSTIDSGIGSEEVIDTPNLRRES